MWCVIYAWLLSRPNLATTNVHLCVFIKQKKDVKSGPSSRQRRCKRLREEIATLKKAYTEAPPEERDGIQEIQGEKLKQLRMSKQQKIRNVTFLFRK